MEVGSLVLNLHDGWSALGGRGVLGTAGQVALTPYFITPILR